MSLIQPQSSGRDAAINIASLSRTMLGSNECVKCVVQDDKELFVTSAALLLQNLEIQHPIGQYVVSACQSFHQQHGTAVKTLLFLIGGLTRAADNLLEKGIPKTAVINGMEAAVNLCCQKMRDMGISTGELVQQQQADKALSDSELPPFTSKASKRNLGSSKERKIKEVVHNKHEIPAPNLQLEQYGEVSQPKLLSADFDMTKQPPLSNKNHILGIEKYVDSNKGEGFRNSKGSYNMDLSHFAETKAVVLQMKMAESDMNRESEDIEWFFEDDSLEQLSGISNSSQLEQLFSVNDGRTETSSPSVVATPSSYQKGESKDFSHSDMKVDLQNKEYMPENFSLHKETGSSRCDQESSDSEFDDCFEATSHENTTNIRNHQLDDDKNDHDDNDEDFDACFESEISTKGQILGQGTEQSVPLLESLKISSNEDILRTDSFKESDACASLPQKENTEKTFDFTGLENLLKTKGIHVGKKKITSATNIMNSSRHFKTADLSLQASIGESTVNGVQSQTNIPPTVDVNGHLLGREYSVHRASDTDVVFDIKSNNTRTDYSTDDTGCVVSGKSDTTPAGHGDIDYLSSSRASHKQEDFQLPTNSKVLSRPSDKCAAGVHSPSSLLKKLDSLQMKMQISKEKTNKVGLLHSRHFTENSKLVDRCLHLNESIEAVDQGQDLEPREDNSVNVPSEMASYDFNEMDSKWSWLKYLGRGLSHGAHRIMDVVVQAVINQATLDHTYTDQDNFHENVRLDVTRLHCCSMLGPVSNTTQLVQGVVIAIPNHVAPLIHRNQGRQLTTLMINADVTKTFRHIGYKKATNVTKISTADRFIKSDGGDDWLSKVLSTLQGFSIEAIMARGSISEEVKVICESHDIVALENVPYTALLAMCSVSQTVMTSYLLDSCEDNICNSIKVSLYHEGWMDCYGNSSYVKVTCGNMPIQTCVISHPSSGVRDTEEQKFWRCAKSMSSALKTGKVVYGAGQTEKHCGQILMKQADLMIKNYSSWSGWISEKVFYPVIYEEVCLVLEDYHDTVTKNACVSTAGTHRNSSILKRHGYLNRTLTDFTSVNSRNDYSAENTLTKLVNSSSHNFVENMTSDSNDVNIETTSSALSQSHRGLDGEINPMQDTTGHSETLIVDDLASKMAAFKIAFQTVRTILSCDTYITTGQYGVKTSDRMLDKILGNHVIL